MLDITGLVKEASDSEELMEMAVDFNEAGYLSDYAFNKLASAYEDGIVDEFYDIQDEFLSKVAGLQKEALFGKKSLKDRAKKYVSKKRKMAAKWMKKHPKTVRGLKGAGALGALGAAGAAGYGLGRN